MAVSIKEEGLLLLDQSSDYMSDSNHLNLANTLDLPDNFDHVVNQLFTRSGADVLYTPSPRPPRLRRTQYQRQKNNVLAGWVPQKAEPTLRGRIEQNSTAV